MCSDLSPLKEDGHGNDTGTALMEWSGVRPSSLVSLQFPLSLYHTIFKFPVLAQSHDSCTEYLCWRDTYSQISNLEEWPEVITVRMLSDPERERERDNVNSERHRHMSAVLLGVHEHLG